jgi:hypothetical protein
MEINRRQRKLWNEFRFKIILRMANYEVLLQLTGPSICLIDTKYRTAVPPTIRLAAAW